MAASEIPPPIFILGAPRSFTSVVCAVIGQHPEVYGVPELNLFIAATLDKMCEKLVGLRQIQLHGLLRTVAHLYSGEQTLASVDMARRWILRRLGHSTADVYWELCEKIAPLRVIDKSPVYSATQTNLERIRHAFPEAHYLYLSRHPRSQGDSILNVAGGVMAVLTDSLDYSTDPATIDPQIAWCRIQRNILAFLNTIPQERKMQLRGEDLLSEPVGYLRKICQWLKISQSDQAIECMLHPEDSPFACLGPLGAHLGNDINFLRSPELRPAKIKSSSLTGPLPWRKDGKGFNSAVIKVARGMGYN